MRIGKEFDDLTAASRMVSEPPPPRVTHLSLPHWEAAAKGELALQRCGACDRFRFPISPVCPFCGGLESTWQAVSGLGRVWTFAVVRRPMMPAFWLEPPYVVALVALDEGPRYLANVVGERALDDVRIGTRVEVSFHDEGDGLTMPRFVIVDES